MHNTPPPRQAVTEAATRKETRWLAALFTLTLVAQVVHFFGLSLPQQVSKIPDDSFFYLQLGLRYWQTGEFTFDGDAQTYGFQPFWQLLMIALAAVLPTTKSLFLGTFVICAALHVAIGWRLYRLARLCFGASAGFAVAAVWTLNPALMSWCWGLKENALYALLLVIALTQLVRQLRGGVTTQGAIRLGIVLGVMVFTRVNSLAQAGIILATLTCSWGLANSWRHRLRGALTAALVAAIVAAPWYVFAWWHFGSAMPTSGTFKLGLMKAHVEFVWKTEWLSVAHAQHALGLWPAYLASLFNRGYGMFRPLLIAAAVTWPVLAIVARFSAARISLMPNGSGPAVSALLALAFGAAASSFTNQMVLPQYLAYAGWYAVPEYLLGALVGGSLLAACWRLRGRMIGVGLGVISLTAAWWIWPAHLYRPHINQDAVFVKQPQMAQLIELGLWARDHVPNEVGIGIWDPGIVTYFSGKRLVSFDPLMNSLSYQQGDILDPVGYVKKRKIAYMIGVADHVGDQWRYIPLPPNSYEIVWLPYPDQGVGFGTTRNDNMVLVRPLESPVPECLTAADFPCGTLYPNDPSRRRSITRDRDRLIAGRTPASDIVRLWLNVPTDGAVLELLANGLVVQTFQPGAHGFHSVDVRSFRGHALSVSWPGGDPATVIEQAHIVDYAW
jgi:hypothetical protein